MPTASPRRLAKEPRAAPADPDGSEPHWRSAGGGGEGAGGGV